MQTVGEAGVVGGEGGGLWSLAAEAVAMALLVVMLGHCPRATRKEEEEEAEEEEEKKEKEEKVLPCDDIGQHTVRSAGAKQAYSSRRVCWLITSGHRRRGRRHCLGRCLFLVYRCGLVISKCAVWHRNEQLESNKFAPARLNSSHLGFFLRGRLLLRRSARKRLGLFQQGAGDGFQFGNRPSLESYLSSPSL